MFLIGSMSNGLKEVNPFGTVPFIIFITKFIEKRCC